MAKMTVRSSLVLAGVTLATGMLVVSCKQRGPAAGSEAPIVQSRAGTADPDPVGIEPTAGLETDSKDDAEMAAGEAAKAGYAPLPLVLPKPMFVGTREPIVGIPKLRKVETRARPPFYAPAGCENVAFGKPVSGSDEEPIMGELDMITDGDREAADGSYVELGPFLQHVTIDLGEEHDIHAIVLWHWHKRPRVYFDVVVQVAKDEHFIDAATVFNNDLDNSAGLGVGEDMHYVETHEGLLIDAKGIRGRYVRCYSQGNSANDLNHYVEVEAWGK